MLTVLEARTPSGALLTLPLIGEDTGGFDISDIQGLDPVKANIVSTGFARLDGEQFQSVRREKRNLVIRMDLDADNSIMTVDQLRKKLYKFFMPKNQVFLRFLSDTMEPVDISGYIESFDSPRFVAEPTATISIICHEPDFVETAPVDIVGQTVATSSSLMINYTGDVSTGVHLKLELNRDIGGFTIYHRPAGRPWRTLEFTDTLLAGDILDLSTIPGSKYATRTRANVESSVLYGVDPDADWTQLEEGSNSFQVRVDGAAVPYTLTYFRRYGGL